MAETRKTLIVGIALFVAVCFIIVVVAAESTLNTSENASASGAQALAEQVEGSTDIESRCEAVRCDATSIACPDGYAASCENACDAATGSCSSCTPSCEGQEQETSQAVNETREEPAREGIGNVSEKGEAANETQRVEANASSSEQGRDTNASATGKHIEMQVAYPKKILRGESIELVISVANKGLTDIRNLTLDITTPPGFEILSIEGAECETLAIGETCVATVRAKVSPSAALGRSKIQIKGGETNA